MQTLKIVIECDQEIPQSQTADNPMAPFKTEWVIQNKLLPLQLGKSSIRMGFTWQGSDHIQEI